MKDQYKTKKQLIEELEVLRKQLAEPKKTDAKQKRAEETLQESEETFKALAENANDGIFVTIGEGLQVYANKRASEITGYSLTELLKSTMKDLLHPDEFEKLVRKYRKRLEGKPISSQYETVLIRKDGKSLPVEVTVAKTTWYGQPADSVIIRDISKRKHTEEALMRSETFLNSIIERSPHAMWISDDKGTLIRLNQACRDLLHLRDEEVVGKYNVLQDNVVKEAGFLPLVKQVFEKGATVNFTLKYDSSRVKHLELKETVFVILNVTISPFFNASGKLTNAIIQHIDITDQKQAEEALRESEEKYRNLVERANDGIAIGQDGIIRYANPRLAHMAGYTVEELTGAPMFDFFFPEERPKLFDRFRRRMAGEDVPPVYESALKYKDGSRIEVEINAGVISYNGKPADLVLFRDITGRKRAEVALRESEENFRRSLDDSPLGIRIVTSEGDTIYANQSALEIYGYDSLEELQRIPVKERYMPESYAEFKIRKEKRKRGEFSPSEYEISIVRKDGEVRRVQVFRKEVMWNGQRQFQVIYQDITQRKKAEMALRESEERFRKVIETMKVGLGTIDEKGVLTYVNEYFSTMLGYTIDEMIGRSTLDFYYDEKERKAQEEIFVKRRAGMRDSTPYEVTWRKKDGQKIYSILSPTPLFDANGRYTGSFAIHTDITERKRMETALRESEERFRKVVETMKVGLATVDRNGILTYVNEYSSNMIGYTTDEMIGHAPTDFYYDEEGRKAQEEIFVKRREGMRDAPTHEVAWRTKDGRKVYSILTPTPIFDEEGRYTGSFAIHTEITERKHAEEALRESEERFRLAFENANTGVCLVDLEGHLTKVNNKMCEIFGYTKEELEHMTLNNVSHPENTEISPAFIQRTLRGETYQGTFEKRYLHKKGHVLTCQVSNSLVRNANGSPLYFISHVQDITERKQAEELLQKERETSFSILENAPYGVALIDKGGQYIYISPEFTNITGYALEDIPTGKDWYQKVFPDQRERKKMIQVWKEDRSKGKMMNREFGIHCKDGKIREIETRVTFLKNGHALIVMRDITEQKLSEERMESLREQLRQSQKMEAIGRLAGGVAHDFNNLLTIIKGYSQLSLIELKEDSPLKKNIEHIHEATDRAANLVRQLLAFSRRQIMEMKVLDINAVLTNLDNMLRRVIGEDIELTTILAEDLGRVKTDQGWIEQAIMNLVVNSRDAMPSGGKLTIETRNADLDEASTYGHFDVEPGRYVMLSVSDTGVGLTPEVMERLFEPFFSTKEKDKGTGLGLSMAYGIVKQSGGDIWVHGEPGKGATFKIYLPRVDEPLEERREKVLGDELFRGTETILLVEDEENVRKLTLRILERHGYKVLSARDGDDALLICEQFKDPIHLMLTDVVMPRMSGHDLAKHLKSSRPKMKVLYMSGYTDNTIVLHGVLMEGVDFIQKPFTVDALTKKIREVLKQ